MQHLGTQTLQTNRLVLRPLCFDDTQMMFSHWAGDPEVARFVRWDAHKSWVVTAEYLNEVAKHYEEPDFYEWGICLRSTGVLVGSIGLSRGEKDSPNEWRGIKRELMGELWEPGYIIGSKWQSNGYATEALDTVLHYWFDQVGGSWLAGHHANQNIASAAVLQKSGFVYDHDTVLHRFDGTPLPCRAYYLLSKED